MSDNAERSSLLYGATAIAEYLGIPVKACRYRIEAKIVPTFRIGGTICATREMLDDWLKAEAAKAMSGQPRPGDRP